MIQSLRCSASKNIKVCFPPLTDFWKIFLFILFRWLSPMTQIFFPNLVASTYVLLPGTIRAFLCARSSSYWLLVMLASGCLLCLVDCFFCFLLLGVWSNEGDIDLIIRFRFVLAFSNGKNFKWIPHWNFGILLMVQFDFLVFTGSFNCYEIFFVVISFMGIYLLNW